LTPTLTQVLRDAAAARSSGLDLRTDGFADVLRAWRWAAGTAELK